MNEDKEDSQYIYIYISGNFIGDGEKKNPTYIHFPSGKTLKLGREWSFQHTGTYITPAIAIRPTKARWGLVDFLWSIMDSIEELAPT